VLWNVIYKNTFEKVGESLIFECEINNQDIKYVCKHNTFLKDILIAWHNIKNDKLNETAGKQVIWNNSKIRKGSNLLYMKDWYDKGIKYIEHFLTTEKKTSTLLSILKN
jgi:hypothetical protein